MKISNLLWGLFFIVVGVIFGLNALNITNIDLFFDGWWTLFIIIPCFIDLFKDKNKTGNIIGLIIGLSLLLASLDIINFEIVWKLLIPIILVIIGLSFIFKDLFNNKVKQEIKNDNEEYCATFASQQLDFSNEKFTGGTFTAVFGGVKCDLKNSIIKDDVLMNCSAIFGGITIYVPDNVNIKINATPIFGGVSDERKNMNKDNKVTIYINATALFGGVEIK